MSRGKVESKKSRVESKKSRVESKKSRVDKCLRNNKVDIFLTKYAEESAFYWALIYKLRIVWFVRLCSTYKTA